MYVQHEFGQGPKWKSVMKTIKECLRLQGMGVNVLKNYKKNLAGVGMGAEGGGWKAGIPPAPPTPSPAGFTGYIPLMRPFHEAKKHAAFWILPTENLSPS